MNNGVWKLLQIEPTKDQALIKKAYAARSKVCHPEEDPEGFMRLREAYNAAMEWAEEEDRGIFPGEESFSQEENLPQEEGFFQGEGSFQGKKKEPELVPHFVFGQETEGPNPYRESPAHQAFLAVYKKENQKNWKLWTEYITSPEFLSVFQEEEFCALMEETVREKESEFRPGQEFIKSLYTAYCFSAMDEGGYDGEDRRLFRQEQNACMPPMPVLAIARACPIPRKATGNDHIMKAAFSNYYHLRSMEEEGSWTDQAMSSLRYILERYVPAYIKDNYTGNEKTETARHPLGIRLLNYFFETARLNRECYQIAWEALGLKQAVMGRNKLLYGRLREICLEKCPELEEEEGSFFELNQLYDRYVEREENDPEQEEAAVKAFFEREDLKRALRNRRYVETTVLTYWISFRKSPTFLKFLRAFYEADRTAPCAKQVLHGIEKAEESRRIYRQNKEDMDAPAFEESISVSCRPFLRYFLNTAFRDFSELGLYLQKYLPYSPEWAGRLLCPEKGREPAPLSRRMALADRPGEMPEERPEGIPVEMSKEMPGSMSGPMEIEVRLHLYYVEYRVNGGEVFRPFLPFEKLKALNTEEWLLLLPLVSHHASHHEGGNPESRELVKELEERLAGTALPAEDQAKLAECLSQGLADRFQEAEMAEKKGIPLPLTICRETPEALYLARWTPEDCRMSLYVEQGQGGMMRRSSQICDDIREDWQAAAHGKRLLEQLIAPAVIDCSCMEKLPEAVYVNEPAAPVRVLENEDVTAEALNGLLEQFAEGGLERLELSFSPNRWELKPEEVESYPRKRALVLLQRKGKYACFYFDDAEYLFYGLYRRNNGIGAGEDDYISLKQRDLPEQFVFDSFASIRCNLEQILKMASRPETFRRVRGVFLQNGCAWQTAWGGVFIQNRRVKYNLAKQELGRFPLERSYNSERQPVLLDTAPEVLNKRPMELEQRSREGAVSITQIDGRKKPAFTGAMKQFFTGETVTLRLSWEVSPEEYRKYFAPQIFEDMLARRKGKPMQCHIVLLREGDRYAMLCLQDPVESAQYCVADKKTYMNVENKYPKESFLGRTMPAYLIHKDPVFLRNRLDLLLDYMECPYPITGRFAEFAGETPGKTREYHVIRKEYTVDAPL